MTSQIPNSLQFDHPGYACRFSPRGLRGSLYHYLRLPNNDSQDPEDYHYFTWYKGNWAIVTRHKALCYARDAFVRAHTPNTIYADDAPAPIIPLDSDSDSSSDLESV